MTSLAFLLCVRDKVKRVEYAARSVLEQSGSSVEVIFSDHSSTDGTRELLRDLAGSYRGPHKVRCLDCPSNSRSGILGLNAHINWVLPQVESDAAVFVSADDVCYPQRAERLASVFDETDADYIITRCRFFVDGEEDGTTKAPGTFGSGQVRLAQLISSQAGLWNGGAVRKRLWDKYGPLQGVEAFDLIFPALATEPLGSGLHLLDECLHDSHHVADPLGASTERAMQAAETEEERQRLIEVNCYQFAASHFSLVRRLNSLCTLSGETEQILGKKLFEASESWYQARDRLTMMNLPPKGLA